MLAESIQSFDDTTLAQLLQEERQERDEEDDEDRNNATFDPVVDRDQVVTPVLIAKELTISSVLADEETLIHCAQHDEHEHE